MADFQEWDNTSTNGSGHQLAADTRSAFENAERARRRARLILWAVGIVFIIVVGAMGAYLVP